MNNTAINKPLEATTPTLNVGLPLVHQAPIEPIALNDYYTENIDIIKQQLLDAGGVLFRGFSIASVIDFESFVNTAIGTVMPYVGGATPRKVLSEKVSTSTEFPPEQEIKLHNELSYEVLMPNLLTFCCLQPSETGGQTQIADVHKVLNYIDKDIVTEFRRRGGWKLIRNFGMGFGPCIKEGFGTDDLNVIRLDCRRRNIQMEILENNVIRTTQIRDAIHKHPISGLELWVNHVVFWHTSSLTEQYLEYMCKIMPMENFPYLTLFGDGTVIPDEYAQNIMLAYQKAETRFDWQSGDVMLLDNRRVAHGRKPYTGERRVIVSMG